VTRVVFKELVTKVVTQGIAQRKGDKDCSKKGVTKGVTQGIGDMGCYSRNCPKNW
jgi:hypothetical protein